MDAVYVLIVLAIIGACAYVIWGKTRATAVVATKQNKNELRDGVTNFLTHRKYLAVSQGDNLMTFAMDKNASCIIAFILLLIGLIPGILYLVLGGSTKTLTIQFTPLQAQDGNNVTIQGQRSIVERVKKFVSMGQVGMVRTTAGAGHTPETGPGQTAIGGPQQQALDPPQVQQKTCVNCNTSVNADLKFCPHCGKQMT